MTSKTAINIMLVLIGLITLFHLALILKIIPYDIAWGGRLTNDAEMYVFETVSISLNLLLGVTLLIKGNYIKQLFSGKTVNVILWIFLIIFALNTVGNVLAKTDFEKYFAILTLSFSILIWRILKSKSNNPGS